MTGSDMNDKPTLEKGVKRNRKLKEEKKRRSE
jgi:hypothetical protein